ncbi:MAG TPA: nuclear transport factor 2 family protein [Terriglobales bacterium]|nr:nuclear transport factor 2 family protein [Terriglobales bacterium]
MHRAKYIIVLVCVTWIWPGLSTAQQDTGAATVRALELKWADAYKSRQFDVLSSFLDDDCVSTFEDGNVFGKLGLISYIAKPSEHIEVVEMSDLKVRMHGETAVVTGAYHEQGVSDGKPYDYHDRFTDVWMKVRGNWKLIASHYSIPSK